MPQHEPRQFGSRRSDEEVRRYLAEQQEDLRLQIENANQRDPEKSRRILQTGLATGLPPEVVESSLDELEERVRQESFDVKEWRDESPVWTSYAAENPYHLAVLQDDREDMTAIERAWDPISLGFKSTWATVEYGRIMARHVEGDHQPDDEKKLKEYQELMVPHLFGAESGFARFLVRNAKMFGPTEYAIESGLRSGMVSAMVFGGAALLFPPTTVTAPAVFGTALSVGFGVGSSRAAYELESGFAYGEYTEAGVDHAAAAVAARSAGAINALLETLGGGAIVKFIPGLKAVQGSIADTLIKNVMRRPTARRAVGMATARFGEVLGIEIITEALQESVTTVLGEAVRPTGTGEPLTVEMWWDRISDTMLEVAQGAFIMSSIGPTGRFMGDAKRAYDARGMEAVYKALGDAAKNSSTREKAAPQFRAFLDRLNEAGPGESFLIDIDRFTEYFQEVGVDPEEMARELGIDLEEARVAGTDLEISRAVYAEKIGATDHHIGLLPDLKANEDQWSAREAIEWQKANPELIEALEAQQAALEGAVPDPEVYEAVRGWLLANGYDETAADQQATLWAAHFTTFAERNPNLGLTAFEFFNQRFGGIFTDRPGVLQGKADVDINIDPLLDSLRAGEEITPSDIFGPSMIDMVVSKTGLEPSSELEARDASKFARGLVRKGGMTADEAAELASEQGYIPEHDETQFWEAFDRELFGEPVYGDLAVDTVLQERNQILNELFDFLESEGIDLDKMTNVEVRERLLSDRTLNQEDRNEILEEAIMATDKVSLSRALSMMSDMADVQDFGALKFTDTVAVEGFEETAEVERSAQQVFDRAVKRRENIQRLMECVSA